MDGHFVPNLTIGPPVVASLRRHTDLFLDCHLMIDNPGELLADFADAGANRLHRPRRARRPRPLFTTCAARGVRVGLVAQPRDPVRRGRALPHRHRPAAGHERAPRLRRPAVHPRRARQGARRPPRSSTATICRSRSRSTAASTPPPRPSPPPPGVDILVAGSAIFGAPEPPRGPGAARGGVADRGVTLAAKVLTVSDGVAAGTRDDRSGTRAHRAAHRRRATTSSSTGSAPTGSTRSPPRSTS